MQLDDLGGDPGLEFVIDAFKRADPTGERAGRIFRATFDQLYDGQRTGRYRWDQLFKTEKTHYGTLIEINLRREFDDILDDGEVLDFRVSDYELDCKYSFRFGGWMIPPECFDQLLLVATANDQTSEWGLGVVRASEAHRRRGVNRDGKSGLSKLGTTNIHWLHWGAELPPNVLLQVPVEVQDAIFRPTSGQQRVNQLFRLVSGRRIGRNTVATVAQQDDYMKRVRENGGARSALAPEGFIIPGGDFESHRMIARRLGAEVPQPGEFVSIRLVPASEDDPFVVELDGMRWRTGGANEWKGSRAPSLPTTRR
ncbi:NaeI family type II restriction endonuclease [Subtercola frigoramans]|uniref:Type II restriction enzyme NaeI domain-containing protein n=1 Tax=Subtercola frigoramans TaxID=120298 RepID=A0ABS2L8T4_9MICO|nr:NaeI family type II restriction endonuclease [Subtercola frigoramans]MBM7473135.1 hypothetical protein [Subtercola frigoramans]